MKNLFYLFVSVVFIGCAAEEELISYGLVIGNDGNEYQTVIIGSQEWMAENLRTTTYSNGDSIPNITSTAQWYDNLTSGAWAHYNNDSQYEIPYGKLYNWYAVNDSRNACPTGWHVPSEAETEVLRDYLGGFQVAGGKMKTTDVGLLGSWASPNVDASNTSGFSGVPGGLRAGDGDRSMGESGKWWTSTAYDGGVINPTVDRAIGFSLSADTGEMLGLNGTQAGGISVRCVKD